MSVSRVAGAEPPVRLFGAGEGTQRSLFHTAIGWSVGAPVPGGAVGGTLEPILR
jgi:hypothetical protein